MPQAAKRPLWKCPKCGHIFVTKNLWHSCVNVPIDAHFRGKPAERRKTFDRWLKAARACGKVTAYAQKSRFGRLGQVHHFRLESPDDVDAALEALMHEAYRVGTQELTARSAEQL
jgi:uncharacterized C2H2 Zn-finger protein